jgi:hypothetical protein
MIEGFGLTETPNATHRDSEQGAQGKELLVRLNEPGTKLKSCQTCA